MPSSFDAVAAWAVSLRRAIAAAEPAGPHLPVRLVQQDGTIELRIAVPARFLQALPAAAATATTPARALASLQDLPLPEHPLARSFLCPDLLGVERDAR